jgi:hypothetical protein
MKKLLVPKADGTMVTVTFTDTAREDGLFMSRYEFDGKSMEVLFRPMPEDKDIPLARLLWDAAALAPMGLDLTRAELALPETERADFKNTAAALDKFDAEFEILSAQLAGAQRSVTVRKLIRLIQLEADKVSHAFWEDTKATNSLEMCLRLRPGRKDEELPSFIRSCVKKWRAEQESIPS